MSPLFKDFSELHILAEESGQPEMFEKILDTMIWKADREYERQVSSSSPDAPSVFDDDEKGPPLVVERFDTLPRYVGKRPAVIDDIFPTNFPTSLYGEGGIAKSIVGLYKLIHISAGMGSCFGWEAASGSRSRIKSLACTSTSSSTAKSRGLVRANLQPASA